MGGRGRGADKTGGEGRGGLRRSLFFGGEEVIIGGCG